MSVSSLAEQQVYRMAVYGVRSSGKTCILSALSIPRVAHPQGLSCSWIQNVQGHELPPGDPASWQTDDPFHLGWQWLNDQRERLKGGDIPAPNPNRETMKFVFDFGSPDDGVRHVELIDYSGELVTASASELAQKLREHMRDCDGILILAEIPHPDRKHAPLADDLEKLAGAFREMLNEREEAPRQEWPVALLLNKWDRRSNAEGQGELKASEFLEEFLGQTPPPPHASLVNTIRNAVGQDNACCFPVSAFGAHAFRDDGAEVPLLEDGRLQSFGLEDGFVWAAQRCDALRVEQIETAAGAASWWAFPQIFTGADVTRHTTRNSAWKHWLWGASPVSGVSSSWRLHHRFPADSALRSRSLRAFWTFGLKLLSQIAVLVVLMLALILASETTLDAIQYRTVLATNNDPSATTAELLHAEEWLEDYFRSPGFRHLITSKTILSSEDAHKLLVEMRSRRDDALWQSVSNAENQQTHLILARKYLKVFPSGRHHAQAKTLVADADRQQLQLRNQEYLAQIALRIDAVETKAGTPLEALHTLTEKIDSLPHPEIRPETITTRQKELRDLIAKKQDLIVEAARQADWQEFKQIYVSLMGGNNVAEAAKVLDGRRPVDDQLRELRDDFSIRAPAIIEAKVRRAIKGSSWQVARESQRVIADPNVVRLLPAESIKALQLLGREIDVAEDRNLYGQVQRYKPHCDDQADAYLSRAPLKTMQSEVKAYRKYITTMREPMNLTLKVTAVKWDAKYVGDVYSYVSDVNLTVKGKPSIVVSGVKSRPNTTTGKPKNGEGEFTAGMNETVSIDVSITGRYGIVWDSTIGSNGQWSGTPNQLRAGVTIPVNGDGFTNKVILSLSGIPKAPALPVWKSR